MANTFAPSANIINSVTSFTPTGSLTTNTTYTGKKWQVGDSIYYDINMAFAGTNTQGAVTITIPDTIDTTKLNTTSPAPPLGFGVYVDANGAGNGRLPLYVRYSSTTTVALEAMVPAAATSHEYRVVDSSANAPVVFSSGDAIQILFKIPV